MNANPRSDQLNGDSAVLAAERALAELRQGRALLVRGDAQHAVVIASAETVSLTLLGRLVSLLPAEHGLSLALTWRRAAALDLAAQVGAPVKLRLRDTTPPEAIAALAGAAGFTTGSAQQTMEHVYAIDACDAPTAAALQLAKHARLLPAVLSVDAAHLPVQQEAQLLRIGIEDIAQFAEPAGVHLQRISEARVPLAGYEHCRLVLFRDARDSAEHVAVVIGEPQPHEPVPVRLHSACLTGDLLGSLRCDCGDQLRNGVEQLAAAGGGVLLYLAQEGRGIGLANKLRAYQLQDCGLDTLEADRHLGFSADERSYAAATAMLSGLGFQRIRLFTNNPEKMSALQAGGIDVVSGERIHAPVNRHNLRYLRAKRERAGHFAPDLRVEPLS